MKRFRFALLSLLLIVVMPSSAQSTNSGYAQALQYRVEVINTYPHDPEAFTQGLLFYDGKLYESTGLQDQSTLREVDIETGEVLRSIDVTKTPEQLESERNYFTEGLGRVGNQLIQLTWTSNLAFVYDLETFEQRATFEYEGQGWGLCYDERYFYMSDSTEYIAIREADTFELIGRMLVTLNGAGIQANYINELECVGEYIYANLWQTDFIVQIDKYNGNIVGVIDASNLLTPDMIREIPGFMEDTNTGQVFLPSNAVLNGIAYNPETDTFYITGKNWSRLFEVRFVALT